MSNLVLEISSHKGVYKVFKGTEISNFFKQEAKNSKHHYLIDENILDLYKDELKDVVATGRVVSVLARESEKSLEEMPSYINKLLENSIRRDHEIVAVGGGITQDICCFISSCLFRGLKWNFVPTTLLAQSDSCIGSKNSINLGKWKNLVGGFYPPERITIFLDFLKTLEKKDLNSGVGEMLKVHIIGGEKRFDEIESRYKELFDLGELMEESIISSLEIKKQLIEVDEFDKGVRNVMNYGHSFGHAIESATEYAIPHGVAVTIGMDMANYVAWKIDRIKESDYLKFKTVLRDNAKQFLVTDIPREVFFSAIKKDKKNVDKGLKLILLNSELSVEIVVLPCDEKFKRICKDYLAELSS